MIGMTIGLLLPGSVFCCLMFIEWWETSKTPVFQVYGKQLPIPLVYLIIFSTGWLWLILMLAERVKRS